jgi:hypothetical protein
MNRQDLQLAEYKEVFAEVRQSIALQYSAIGVGIAFFGILLQQVVVTYAEHKLRCFFLSSCFPFIALLTLFVWLYEVARMRRGAVYLQHLEASLNQSCTSSNSPDNNYIYGFHTWAKLTHSHLKHHYVAIAIFFSAVGILGILLAAWCSLSLTWKGYLLVGEIGIVALFVVCMRLLLRRALRIDCWPVRPAFPNEPKP